MKMCEMCRKNEALADSAFGLCSVCADMVFEQMIQDAAKKDKKDEQDIQEEQANG